MDKILGKKVFVAGATGFIGNNLVRELVRRKAKVSVLIRNKRDLTFFGNLDVNYFVGDILKIKTLDKALKGNEILFNTSGALPYHKLSREEYFEVNKDGIENLMVSALKNKIKKVIHVSTVGIYGENVDGIAEGQSPQPIGSYAESKLAGDEVVKKYYKKGLKTVIIRPTIAYGPYDKRPVILTLFKLVTRRIVPVFGDGKNYFHTVYVGNLVEALMLAATNKNAIGEDFIIGDDPAPTFLQLVKAVAKAMRIDPIIIYIPKPVAYFLFSSFMKSKIDFVSGTKRYKIDKAKRKLKYKAKIKLADGINETLRWYEENKLI